MKQKKRRASGVSGGASPAKGAGVSGRLSGAPTVMVLAGALVAAALAACGDSGGAGGAGGGTSGVTTSGTGSTSATSGTTNTAGSTGSGGTADTWTNYAQGFVTTYCLECHAANDPSRDYSTLARVQMDAAEIRCGTSANIESGCSGFPPPKQFPVDDASHTNPKPSDAERARFVAWIDAGLPN